jgi:hypothetical protein
LASQDVWPQLLGEGVRVREAVEVGRWTSHGDRDDKGVDDERIMGRELQERERRRWKKAVGQQKQQLLERGGGADTLTMMDLPATPDSNIPVNQLRRTSVIRPVDYRKRLEEAGRCDRGRLARGGSISAERRITSSVVNDVVLVPFPLDVARGNPPSYALGSFRRPLLSFMFGSWSHAIREKNGSIYTRPSTERPASPWKQPCPCVLNEGHRPEPSRM